MNTAGTYTVEASNSFGFTTIDTIIVSVNPLPTVSFSGLQANYCANSAAVTLAGIPTGGTFSGSGILGSSFSPQIAGPGSYAITYNYTNLNGCSNSYTLNTQVHSLPSVIFTGLPATACLNASNFALTGMPSGGSFSGPGISGSNFNPAAAGSGNHSITYTGPPDANGCSNSETKSIQIFAPTSVSFSGLAGSYCLNAPAAGLTGSPIGGFFTGPGIAANSFNPLSAGVGLHSIQYSYQDGNGCFSSTTQLATVNNLPLVSAGNDVQVSYLSTTVLTGFAGGGGEILLPMVASITSQQCRIAESNHAWINTHHDIQPHRHQYRHRLSKFRRCYDYGNRRPSKRRNTISQGQYLLRRTVAAQRAWLWWQWNLHLPMEFKWWLHFYPTKSFGKSYHHYNLYGYG